MKRGGKHHQLELSSTIRSIRRTRSRQSSFEWSNKALRSKDLEAMIGTRTRIAEVLSRKRALSIAMIRRLHEKLGIPAEVLIRPTRKDESA